jgi:hypothetical protein
MPCAVTEPNNYPDYIKSILKEISAGNDDDLKGCGCGLRSPVTEDGCLILDEDRKVAAFPFCCPLVTTGVGANTNYPLKLTLKQAMLLYWQLKSFNHSFIEYNKYGTFSQPPTECKGGDSIPSTTQASSGSILILNANAETITEYKKRVCPCSISLYYSFNSTTEGIFGHLFGSGIEPQIKYKKQGNTYYFYPFFEMTSIGEYGQAWSINEFSVGDCPCSCCSPFLTNTTFNVKINNVSSQVSVTLCNSTGGCIVCNNLVSSTNVKFQDLIFNI